ncbi:MAG: hypothetical protein V1921_03595 [Candidatus Altiarchaeota archaeon]
MKLTENRIFAFILLVVILFVFAAYVVNYNREGITRPIEAQSSTTTTLTATTIQTTTIEPVSDVNSQPTEVEEQSTTTTLQPASTANSYFSRFEGRGYRHAYVGVIYQCPSCVPAIASVLNDEPGVIAKSMAYKQKVSWVVYDPTEVTPERMVSILGSSGEASLINDTAI